MTAKKRARKNGIRGRPVRAQTNTMVAATVMMMRAIFRMAAAGNRSNKRVLRAPPTISPSALVPNTSAKIWGLSPMISCITKEDADM